MATNANWTVVFEDKLVIKQSGDAAGTGYNIVDNDFWGLAKWDNVWAIQYGTSNPSDTVEYRDGTSHSTWEDANLGDFSLWCSLSLFLRILSTFSDVMKFGSYKIFFFCPLLIL